MVAAAIGPTRRIVVPTVAMPATAPGRAEPIVPQRRIGREVEVEPVVASTCRRAGRRVLRPHVAGRASPVPAVARVSVLVAGSVVGEAEASVAAVEVGADSAGAAEVAGVPISP